MATEDLDTHLAQVLERVGEISRALRWKQATESDLSPLQLRILGFVNDHAPEPVGVARLAEELQISKPTISDSVKVLAERNLLARKPDKLDGRSHTLKLTTAGRKCLTGASPLDIAVTDLPNAAKEALLLALMGILETLFENGGVQVQRMCWTCQHYKGDRKGQHRCRLLEKTLAIAELRTDCPEHVVATM
ncbi:MAG: MarR family winged helix-turn-helix transcriptional regulator [Flavobacteriales bacterium]|nr:winged helix-turn-helix transcriptional regulator [Flavobacteriales bacterium]